MGHLLYRFKIFMFGRIQADGGQFKLAAKGECGLCELLWFAHSRWILAWSKLTWGNIFFQNMLLHKAAPVTLDYKTLC